MAYRLVEINIVLFITCFKKIGYTMNVKRTFGTVLTVLGIIGLIWTGIMIIQHSGNFTNLTVVGIISVIFFFTGISLIRNTKDEA
jgi:uncharacterized membrane protein